MNKEVEIIKNLIESGLVEEEVRIEVYPMISVPEKYLEKILKKLNVSEAVLWDYIKVYTHEKENNNVFGFYGINGKTAGEIKIIIEKGIVDFKAI